MVKENSGGDSYECDGDIEEFRKSLYATAESMGIKIISDDLCCRILAYVYTYGGANEMVVFNARLRVDIFEAQKRLNLNLIDGDPCPNAELLPVLQDYIKSITGGDEDEFWHGEREYETPPEKEKILELIRELEKFTTVVQKKNLGRLVK